MNWFMNVALFQHTVRYTWQWVCAVIAMYVYRTVRDCGFNFCIDILDGSGRVPARAATNRETLYCTRVSSAFFAHPQSLSVQITDSR